MMASATLTSGSGAGAGTTVALPPLPSTSATASGTGAANDGSGGGAPSAAATAPGQEGGGGGAQSSSNTDEGVLRDVLDELDRERTKRAEVEAQARKLNDELARAREEHESDRIAWHNRQRELEQQKQQGGGGGGGMGAGDRTTPAKAARTRQQHPVDSPPSPKASSTTMSRREFLAMKAQVEGYRQLVEAMTSTRPAIVAAVASQSPKGGIMRSSASASLTGIPIHVLRLLEIMPWDPSARHHVFAFDSVYEWQIYDSREKRWHNQLRYFPAAFKSLPVVKATPAAPSSSSSSKNQSQNQQQKDNIQSSGNTADRSLLLFLAGAASSVAAAGSSAGAAAAAGVGVGVSSGISSQNHSGVLTDERLTRLYSIQSFEFPLPDPRFSGTWEWVGGWRIDKRCHNGNNSNSNEVECDDQGWSYAREAQHFVLTSSSDAAADRPCASASNETAAGQLQSSVAAKESKAPPAAVVVRKIRRRKWIRRRIMVDYPYASDRTREYLKLLAENARLSVAVEKVSQQLAETKTALTEAEGVLVKVRSGLSPTDAKALLKAAASTTNDSQLATTAAAALAAAATTTTTEEAGDAITPLQGFLSVAKNEQVKELGSKISQWVLTARKPSEDSTTSVGSAAAAAAAAANTTADTASNGGPVNGKGSSAEVEDDKKNAAAAAAAASAAQSSGELSSDGVDPMDLSLNSRKFNWSKIGPISFAKKLSSVEAESRTASADDDEEDDIIRRPAS